ncbi:MAG: hypothetical protein LBC68_03775 [Prevotellaceae bacterium]|jgi:hypothetical protein|nr:hypothetical protein [Prevotellaceae bacterium]
MKESTKDMLGIVGLLGMFAIVFAGKIFSKGKPVSNAPDPDPPPEDYEEEYTEEETDLAEPQKTSMFKFTKSIFLDSKPLNFYSYLTYFNYEEKDDVFVDYIAGIGKLKKKKSDLEYKNNLWSGFDKDYQNRLVLLDKQKRSPSDYLNRKERTSFERVKTVDRKLPSWREWHDGVGFLGDVIPGTKSELQRSAKNARDALINSNTVVSVNDEIFKNPDGYIEISPELQRMGNFNNTFLRNKKELDKALRIVKSLDNGFLLIQYKDLAAKGFVGGNTLKELIKWINEVVDTDASERPLNETSAYILTLLELAEGQKVRWDNGLDGGYNVIKRGLGDMVAPVHHTASDTYEQRARLKDRQKKDWTIAAYGSKYLTPDRWAEKMIPEGATPDLELTIRNAVIDVLSTFNTPKHALQELIAFKQAHEMDDLKGAKYYNDLERKQNPEGFYYPAPEQTNEVPF